MNKKDPRGQMARPSHGYIEGLGDFLGGWGGKLDINHNLEILIPSTSLQALVLGLIRLGLKIG